MRKHLPALLVVSLMALYVVTFSAISIRQHDAFLTQKEDLGQIDQAVWNSLHGRLLVETDGEHQSTRLTDHAEPSLAISSLVFLVWDDVRALLIWQALVVALGAWAIFLLATDVLHSHWIAVAFALVYLLCPALEAAHLAEFHAAALAAAPIAFALLFLARGQWRRFFAASLLVVAIKEEMALIGIALGLAASLMLVRAELKSESKSNGRKGNRSAFAGLAFLILISLCWFILTTFVIIPHFGAAKYAVADSIYFQRYGELGATPSALLRTLLTNPPLVLRVLLAPERLGYVGGLLASVGFLALASPWTLLIGAPLLAANLLSNFPAQYSGDFHYSTALVPFFVVAAIYGVRRIEAWIPRPYTQWILIGWLLLCALFYQRVRGYSPLSENFYWPSITPHQRMFERFAAQIPRDARLSTTPPLFPHLSHRELIYEFPVVAAADYLLLDASVVTNMHPNDFRAAVVELQRGGQFGIADSADGYILFKRGADNATLPDSFYDFVRAPNAQPQVRRAIVFGDAVQLIGYDVIPDPRWHEVRTRYYWQALRPLDSDLRLYPFYHDDRGNIIEDTTQRRMVATVWYPPSRWRVGETIQTETLPWDVGDQFALAVGVMHGSDWDRKGRRLVANTGETQVELGVYEWRGKQLIGR